MLYNGRAAPYKVPGHEKIASPNYCAAWCPELTIIQHNYLKWLIILSTFLFIVGIQCEVVSGSLALAPMSEDGWSERFSGKSAHPSLLL